MVISEVFGEPSAGESRIRQETALQGIQVGITEKMALPPLTASPDRGFCTALPV
jgi:hypothetical protein